MFALGTVGLWLVAWAGFTVLMYALRASRGHTDDHDTIRAVAEAAPQQRLNPDARIRAGRRVALRIDLIIAAVYALAPTLVALSAWLSFS